MQQKQGLQAKKDFKKQLQKIRIGFVKSGISLNRFCEQNGIDYANARKSILGIKNGEKAQQLRQRLIDASKGKTE
jgi:hypothetical protein